MAKIKKNNPTTMETLAMDASDRVTDRKTSIMPGLLVNVLQQRAPVTCIEVKDQRVTGAVHMTEQYSRARGIMGQLNSVAHAMAPCYLAKLVAALTIK